MRDSRPLLQDPFPSVGCQKKPREYSKFTDRQADPDSSLTTLIKPSVHSTTVQTPRSDFLSTPAPSPPKVTHEIEFDTIRLRSHVNAPQIGPAEVK